MAGFDYAVIIIGSEFGGSVAAYMPTDVDRNMRNVAVVIGHGETFNAVTGPNTEPLGVHEAREVDGEIQVRI